MAGWIVLASLCVCILQGLCPVTSLPNGAPASACADMMPRHSGVNPQPSPVPYTITVSSRTFTADQPVKVTIKGPDYKGVLLQARMGNSYIALGSWKLPPADTKVLQCSGNPNGAMTHSNINIKNNSTVYTWIPHTNSNMVYFMATVAQERTVYWLNVKSDMLTRKDLSLDAGARPVTWGTSGVLLIIASLFLTILCSS